MMELTTLECNLTAKPLVSQENTKSSISINIRRFRQSVQRKPSGYETIKKHRLVSSLAKVSYEVTPKRASNQEYIDKMLVRLIIKRQTMNRWLRKRVSALISSKASECMKDDKAYSVVADVDVIFGKHKLLNEIKNPVEVEEEEEKNCAICLGDLSGGGECMEVQCSHVFHRECIWMWLRKKMSCPTCRSCICGENICSHADVGSDHEY